ncbi:hypothetical protein PENVUL_c015G00125 [Penicillium vulpinum]|uniref:Uncharacterized protein n=1 Tax=Penicillium vulpinum TaxID=29845 RepID=A0A1V6S082_9EURO|nr:hypothetical protein PENVUL_c015G00125 [Penicillium vulpinum]
MAANKHTQPFATWEMIHGKLPWERAFARETRTLEANGNEPTSGDLDRIVEVSTVSPRPDRRTRLRQCRWSTNIPGRYPLTLCSSTGRYCACYAHIDMQFPSFAKDSVIIGGYANLNLLETTQGPVAFSDRGVVKIHFAQLVQRTAL